MCCVAADWKVQFASSFDRYKTIKTWLFYNKESHQLTFMAQLYLSKSKSNVQENPLTNSGNLVYFIIIIII